jgi:hypothetical protein
MADEKNSFEWWDMTGGREGCPIEVIAMLWKTHQ